MTVEDCDAPEPTRSTRAHSTAQQHLTTGSGTTSPAPTNNVGTIVGIVLGTVAAAAIVLGLSVYVVRKRQSKEVEYRNVIQ